ncbi:MAG TPA: hypothetical protein V6C69_02250 [Trichormus sp.]
MHQDRSPNPISADTAEFNAADLHVSAQLGEKAYPYILDRMGEYNTNFKGEPKKLQEIAHIYKELSKNDPVFANEVQIAADGSLNFYPNKITSPQLRKLEDNLIADSIRVLHDRQNNMFESDDADRVLKDIAALQKEEKRLVPPPKNSADTNQALYDPQASAANLHDTSLLGASANSEMLNTVGRLNVHYQHDPKILRHIAHMYKDLSKNDPLFANEIQIGAGGLLEFIPTKRKSEKLQSLETKLGYDEATRKEQNAQFPVPPGMSVVDPWINADKNAMQREERRVLGLPQL